jgi:hypothetical protein
MRKILQPGQRIPPKTRLPISVAVFTIFKQWFFAISCFPDYFNIFLGFKKNINPFSQHKDHQLLVFEYSLENNPAYSKTKN